MDVGVIGAGYVGLVTAVGLASLGHRVSVGERDPERLEQLQSGRSPIFEDGLESLLVEHSATGALSFYGDNNDVLKRAGIVVIALPTPQGTDGQADTTFITSALEAMAPHMEPGTVVVLKSTVPIGTNARMTALIGDHASGVTVVSNPEFLREGRAIHDFLHPDRIVIGGSHTDSVELVAKMYADIDAPIVVTSPEAAELIKYASNAYLATRVSFANEIANLGDAMGLDVHDVLEAVGLDSRIGSHFLRPGPGYGGSCFPKDTAALVSIADNAGYDLTLVKAAMEVNARQPDRVISKLNEHLGDLADKKIAVWGIAFKADTDDVRESPAVRVISQLMTLGADVTAFDPHASGTGLDIEPEIAETALGAATNADALVIATEWADFADADLEMVRVAMAGNVIVDARNMLDPKVARSTGFHYVGMGR